VLCAVSVPAADAENVCSQDHAAFLLDYADHHIDRRDIDRRDFTDTLDVGDTFHAGGLAWRALAAPGHDANALVFLVRAGAGADDRRCTLENRFGIMFPDPTLEHALGGGLATLDRIAALTPRWVIPGHAVPFTDVRAIDRARRKLDAFAADPAKNPRHGLKSLLSFALLERKRTRVDEMLADIVAVPCFRDLNERLLRRPLPPLAEALMAELVRVQAIAIDAGWITPTPVA
jgi:glyoxylase-like metal-dependent hydrolase (beta-lactamase superfamily II)